MEKTFANEDAERQGVAFQVQETIYAKAQRPENNDVFGGRERMCAEAGGSVHKEITKRQSRKVSWSPITKAKVEFIWKVMGS